MCAYVPLRIYKNIHRSTICNSPKLETTQMLINSKMNKCMHLYSSNR